MTELVADVAIVGSGVAGAIVAARLAAAGTKVLLVEAGPRVDRAEAAGLLLRARDHAAPHVVYPDVAHAPRPRFGAPDAYFVHQGPDVYPGIFERRVGGTTWHWLGTAIRLLPRDFRMRSRFGVGVDWPLTYDDLEPWYVEAERELGVAGDPTVGPPRSAPYPMPPIPLSYADQRVAAAGATLGLRIAATSQARNSVAYGGRPPCAGSGSCVPICPIGAKYDGGVHVAQAERAGAQVLDNAVVTTVEADPRGVTGLRGLRPDGSAFRVTAKRYVLACNGIETPRLLLASASDVWPAGVANRSDQVGRNFMDHVLTAQLGLARDPIFVPRGPLSTAGSEDPRDPDSRGERAGFRVESFNTGWIGAGGAPTQVAAELIRKGLRGPELDAAIRAHVSAQVRLAAMVEQLPDPQNRITAVTDQRDALGQPRVGLRWSIGAYTRAGLDAARPLLTSLMDAVGVSTQQTEPGLAAGHHPSGTCRMGADPRLSVVDADLRAHDLPNLHIVGSATFPTIGTANPTLTIAALALRLAAHLQGAG